MERDWERLMRIKVPFGLLRVIVSFYTVLSSGGLDFWKRIRQTVDQRLSKA